MSDRNLLDAVAAALRRDLTDDEKGSVDHLAVGAAALIRGHLGQPPPSDDKDAAAAVRYVTAQMIARALSRAGAADAGLATRTTTTGPFTVQQGYATDAQGGGVWLTRQDQIMLAPWRLGLVCAPLVSERAP